MKRKLMMTFFLILAISVFGQENGEELVRKAFDNYNTALMNHYGKEAVKYVDDKTIKYFTDILDQVKNADSTKIETFSINDKIMVFSIRHRISKDNILSFDGTTLLIHAINESMVGKNSIPNNSIGDVSIDNNMAKGQFLVKGQKVPFFLFFNKEGGEWKFDMTSTFSIVSDAFQKKANDSGQNENEFIFKLLAMMTGKKPGLDIWQPIK